MSPVAAPTDRRFRRAHVKPARRQNRWRGIVRPVLRLGLSLLLLAYGAHRGTRVIADSGMLRVDQIVVRGIDRLSKGEVLAVLEGLHGRNLVSADLDLWRRRLRTSPWVRDAALRRSFPSTVEVAVIERQAVGIGRLAGGMYLVDELGVVIDQYGPQYADLDLPIIDGLAPEGSTGAAADLARAGLAARLIAAVRERPEIAHRVSQIDVSNLHDAVVILSGDTAVLHLGDDRFLQRLQSYAELAPAIRERVGEVDYVDLRFEQRVFVRPFSGGDDGSRGPRPVTGGGPGDARPFGG
jgi:cell division septal protein FtsQ